MQLEKTHPSCGLTLTSLMVAVALSGLLAVAGVRLVGTQMNTLRVMELREKGDSIFKFYSNLLHDDKAWWCTLYDGAPNTSTTNKAMRDCVLGKVQTCASGEQPMRLMGPNCQIKFTAQGERDFSSANFRVGSVFIPSTGKDLKDSAMEVASRGWWKVKVTWKHTSNKAVDLILTQTFNESNWQNAAPSVGKRYLPELDYPRTLRVRRSANYVRSNTETTKAITAIALHTATISRDVSRHTSPLVDTTANGLGNCHEGDPKGQVVMSTSACSGDRVAVSPKACGTSVIAQIGTGTGITATDNIRCALDGSGKLVQYGECSTRNWAWDVCQGNGLTRYAYGGRWSTPRWASPMPQVITRITNSGGIACKGMPSWPGPQGSMGRKGSDGRGPRGVRGPRGHPYWHQDCS